MVKELSPYHGICENITGQELTRILFLDIDGVMVTDYSKENRDEVTHEHLFNPVAVNLLNAIVEQTECHIVISSSWRKRDTEWIRKVFKDRSFKYPERIVGETMRGYQCVEKSAHLPIPRGVEIKAWLDLFVRKTPAGFTNNNYQYAILDDDSDMLLEQKDNFVKTKGEEGLTVKNAERVLWIFNN